MTSPMPAIFFGHANPLNALARNADTEGWAAIGKCVWGEVPGFVLLISLHDGLSLVN